MIIDDFDVQRFAIVPDEADPVLIVGTDAVLSLAVAAQRFERVAGGAQIGQSDRVMQLRQSPVGRFLDSLQRTTADVGCERSLRYPDE
jgi:hypothetical protein